MVEQQILIASALKKETKNINTKLNILYTGIGKINSSISLTQNFEKNINKLPKLVINFGTAGSRNLSIGKLVKCSKFIQRDIDLTPLGFKKGETAFDENIPSMLDFSENENNEYVCGTGDSFVQDISKELEIIDIFDMEAYALAKVCYYYKVPFISYKYITDNANKQSSEDWNLNLSKGVKMFENVLKYYI